MVTGQCLCSTHYSSHPPLQQVLLQRNERHWAPRSKVSSSKRSLLLLTQLLETWTFWISFPYHKNHLSSSSSFFHLHLSTSASGQDQNQVTIKASPTVLPAPQESENSSCPTGHINPTPIHPSPPFWHRRSSTFHSTASFYARDDPASKGEGRQSAPALSLLRFSIMKIGLSPTDIALKRSTTLQRK